MGPGLKTQLPMGVTVFLLLSPFCTFGGNDRTGLWIWRQQGRHGLVCVCSVHGPLRAGGATRQHRPVKVVCLK